jgi:hypothetical protein
VLQQLETNLKNQHFLFIHVNADEKETKVDCYIASGKFYFLVVVESVWSIKFLHH